MNNYIPNQFSNVGSIGNVEQKLAQLNQDQQQSQFQNVQQYVNNAQVSNFSNLSSSVEQNAKNLRLQDAKNYIQQMNSKIGLQ